LLIMEVTQLIAALHSDDPARRQAAAERLAQLGTGAQEAAVALVEACGCDDEPMREWITAALEELGPPRVDDIPLLAELVARPSLDTAYWAATLLGRLEREAAPAVAALAAALSNHAEMAVRQRAAWALAQIGAPSGAARGALQSAAASSNRRLASLARQALSRIEP
jgi:HEAT repeat protein